MLDKKLYEDSLREVTSIGCGHSATRLSQMIDRKVKIKLPRVWFGKLEESYLLGEKKVIAISNNFGIVKRGLVIQMMSPSTATHLLRLFLKEKILEFGELEKSALLEVSNILTGG